MGYMPVEEEGKEWKKGNGHTCWVSNVNKYIHLRTSGGTSFKQDGVVCQTSQRINREALKTLK